MPRLNITQEIYIAGSNNNNTSQTDESCNEYAASANKYNGQLNKKPRITCLTINNIAATLRWYFCLGEL